MFFQVEQIYVSAERGQEEALLKKVTGALESSRGQYRVRVKRGSGWVQIDPQEWNPFASDPDPPSQPERVYQETHDPQLRPPKYRETACTLSDELGRDVVYVTASSAAEELGFERCHNGSSTRDFMYIPIHPHNHGWTIDVGTPEPWEKDWGREGDPGPEPTLLDVGQALALPSLENGYTEHYVWDLEVTVSQPAKRGWSAWWLILLLPVVAAALIIYRNRRLAE